MALEGTIRDFGLPDILQLIGIQRKTGVLTLENNRDMVTVKFLEGQVVGADTKTETIEERLGEVLVRTGRITPAQLKEALETQQQTLQRLGHILVKSKRISQDELVEALMVQSTQIIYRLFRWHEGRYQFKSAETVDYDQAHFVPISSETILMEGARMTDEWPIIERRIRSDGAVLARTAALEAALSEVQSIIAEDIDFSLEMEEAFKQAGGETEEQPGPEAPADDQITLSPEEREVLNLVDGKRTVREICDLVTLGEFDTYRILYEMLTRQLVETIQPTTSAPREPRAAHWFSNVTFLLAMTLMVVSIFAGLVTVRSHPATPWRLLAAAPATDELRLYVSMAKLERMEKAVRVFYLDTGALPPNTSILAAGGYLAPDDLWDPWGRSYEFHISDGGYRLVGMDAAGEPRADLTVSRRFNAVQRMMLQANPSEPAPHANP